MLAFLVVTYVLLGALWLLATDAETFGRVVGAAVVIVVWPTFVISRVIRRIDKWLLSLNSHRI